MVSCCPLGLQCWELTLALSASLSQWTLTGRPLVCPHGAAHTSLTYLLAVLGLGLGQHEVLGGPQLTAFRAPLMGAISPSAESLGGHLFSPQDVLPNTTATRLLGSE